MCGGCYVLRKETTGSGEMLGMSFSYLMDEQVKVAAIIMPTRRFTRSAPAPRLKRSMMLRQCKSVS